MVERPIHLAVRGRLALIALLVGCAAPSESSKAPRFDPGSSDAVAEVDRLARDHLAQGGLVANIDALATGRTFVDQKGTAHLRLEQAHRGLPVLGGQAIVHVPPDGTPITVTDRLLQDLDLGVTPKLDEGRAETIARAHAERPSAEVETIELFVLRENGGDHLAWRVALRDAVDGVPTRPITFVDATTGAVVLAYDDVHTIRDRETYDAQNTWVVSNPPARTETTPPVGNVGVDGAHDHAGIAWDYYDTFHGRDSYDDAGATVISVANIGTNYPNAFWDGVLLGYGGGSNGIPSYAQSLDVVAHEFTHAVTTSTANLVYSEQSGGLNEATSDIMGAVIEAWNDGWVVSADTWELGEDLYGTGIRNMANPPSNGSAIDSYLNYTNSLGVHQTSGIANRAFVEWVDDPSLTIEEAGDVWYQALNAYMTPRTTFAEARQASQQAALDLFGPGPEVLAVADGWDFVDVPGTPAYAIFDDVGPISLTAGQQAIYTFTADSTALAVRFLLVGDNGDADLYVSAGTMPTTTTADCASISSSSREICTFDPSPGTTYEVLVVAFSDFTDVELSAWEAVPNGGPCPDFDQDGFSTCDGDCDDNEALVWPGADELCNGVDDDCDGTIDGDDATDRPSWYADVDEDGFGDAATETFACEAPEGMVANATDCDDGEETVFPGANELCNGVDDNCDTEIDEATAVDAPVWYADVDGDGFGDASQGAAACAQPEDTVANDGDCNDALRDVNPDADEVCNGLDDDCDAVTDPPEALDAPTWFRDSDGDGFGDAAVAERACLVPTGFVRDATDCDDALRDVNPDAVEVCNGLDDDCDAVTDPPTSADVAIWYADGDGDGYGDLSRPEPSCMAPKGFVLDSTDCDDLRGDVSPGASEVCDAADVDEDCDGTADEAGAVGELAYWLDGDGDGFGDALTEAVACNWPANAVAAGGREDCDDQFDDVFPGADEVCDERDQNCDDVVDNDAIDVRTFYVDADGDGYGSDPVEDCVAPEGTVAEGGDCDDREPSVFPGADEVADDGIDQDCDGTDQRTPEPVDTGVVPEPTDPALDEPLTERGVAPEPVGCTTTGSPVGLWWIAGVLALFLRRRQA